MKGIEAKVKIKKDRKTNKNENDDSKEKSLEKTQSKRNENLHSIFHSILFMNVDIKFAALAVIYLVFICISVTPITFQNDTFYTIKIGELIKNSGIDMMDHFSWHENLPYTYPHWLYDFLTYLVYAKGGFKGVYILTFVLSVILGVSIFTVNNKLNKNAPLAFIVTVGTIYMLRDYITARAQLVTFILFIWEVYCIEKFIENRKLIYAIILVAISLLIANLHVAVWPFFFVVFLPYIAEYLISLISDCIVYQKSKDLMFRRKIKSYKKKNVNPEEQKRLNQKYEEFKQHISRVKIKRQKDMENPYKILVKTKPNVKWLIIIMIICALMGLLTPLKDTPYTYLYKTMKGNTTENINEHLPLTLADSTDIICVLIIFLAVLIFSDAKIRLSDLFMLGGLCYLMFESRRQSSIFVLICSIILTRMVIDLINRHTENGLKNIEDFFKNIWVIILTTMLVSTLCLHFWKPKKNDPYVDSSSYPVDACDYILKTMDLSNVRFYNNYNYGSYMLFRGIPVFIDSRADLYTPEFNGNEDEDIFSDFLDSSGLGTFYEDTFNKYHITHLLIPKNSKISMIIERTHDENYKELYKDSHFIIYERLNDNVD